MARTRGTITLVQEERFQLVDEEGVAHLFILDQHVLLGPSELHAIWSKGERVEVEYRDADPLIARVATSVNPSSGAEL